MKIEREEVKKDGTSCNFCDRGKLKTNGTIGLDYPYDKVTTIQRDKGNGIKVSICDDCMTELTKTYLRNNLLERGKVPAKTKRNYGR